MAGGEGRSAHLALPRFQPGDRFVPKPRPGGCGDRPARETIEAATDFPAERALIGAGSRTSARSGSTPSPSQNSPSTSISRTRASRSWRNMRSLWSGKRP
jgi:hypothetical protein